MSVWLEPSLSTCTLESWKVLPLNAASIGNFDFKDSQRSIGVAMESYSPTIKTECIVALAMLLPR
jgi:hypothetical protein